MKRNIVRQKYGIVTTPYVKYGRLQLHELCNGFVIKNTGTTQVLFMSDVLDPGESKAFGGNQDEILLMTEDINFQVQAVPPGTITNAALVTQKIFVDED